MEVTNEQKTIELAMKVMGWTWGADSCGRECWLDCEGLPACLGEFDPFHVRDDADELMGRLTDEQWWDVVSDDFYFQWVALNDSRLTYARFILTATPALISEAVWRATSQPNGNYRLWPVSAELQRCRDAQTARRDLAAGGAPGGTRAAAGSRGGSGDLRHGR